MEEKIQSEKVTNLTLILFYLINVAVGNELNPLEYLNLRQLMLNTGYDPKIFDEKTLFEVLQFFCGEYANL